MRFSTPSCSPYAFILPHPNPSPKGATHCTQLLLSLTYTAHDELTPIPSLLRKEGRARNKVPTMIIKILPFICWVFPSLPTD
jgi:hypothetical protein